jgi:hypothetical protein
VHFSITGQGGKVRQALLPEIVSLSLLSLRGTRILTSEVAGATISKKILHHFRTLTVFV